MALAVALGSSAQAQAQAQAQAPQAQTPQAPLVQGGHETTPTSELLVAAAAALRAPGHDEVSVRGLAVGSRRAGLKVGRVDYALTGAEAGAAMPRFAVGAAPGPVAFLVRVEAGDPTAAASSELSQPVYALATASLTRIGVWSFFRGLPDDAVLSAAMARVIAHAQPVLMQFDPTFRPGTEPGAQRYVLKPLPATGG